MCARRVLDSNPDGLTDSTVPTVSRSAASGFSRSGGPSARPLAVRLGTVWSRSSKLGGSRIPARSDGYALPTECLDPSVDLNVSDRFQPTPPEPLVGLQIVALCPFVPRLDEQEPRVVRTVRDKSGGNLELPTKRFRGRPEEHASVPARAGRVVPIRNDAWVYVAAERRPEDPFWSDLFVVEDERVP